MAPIDLLDRVATNFQFMESIISGKHNKAKARPPGLRLSSKESACNADGGDSIPGLGGSPEGGNGNPLQCSWLESPMDRGAWRATFHAVSELDMT